jgi:hypothetical protein
VAPVSGRTEAGRASLSPSPARSQVHTRARRARTGKITSRRWRSHVAARRFFWRALFRALQERNSLMTTITDNPQGTLARGKLPVF